MAGGFTAEGLDFCFALRQKGNVVRPKACSNCRSHLTRFCEKKGLCARIFALFGIVHCVAFRQKRNAVRPEVRNSSL